MTSFDDGYPGHTASPAEVLELADAYGAAARALLSLGKRGKPLSWAPFRFSALHAIELYLNALLLRSGHTPAAVRGLQHDLNARKDLALVSGLQLRKRTLHHLQAITGTREYLIARYGPEVLATASNVNRLTATLDEVGAKVRNALHQNKAPSASSGRG